jgi:hypothetical protein
MTFIRDLRNRIAELMKENRQKRLDAEENARLEQLMKQQTQETERLKAQRKRRASEREESAQPEPAKPVNTESESVSLSVLGGVGVTCNRADYEKIKILQPFFWHVAENGSMFPATVYPVEGRKVLMPLQNLAPSLKASGQSLSAAPTEPFATPQEYRQIQQQRTKCRNEHPKNSRT